MQREEQEEGGWERRTLYSMRLRLSAVYSQIVQRTSVNIQDSLN